MNIFKKLYYSLVPTYEILEERFVSYTEADKLIRETNSLEESNKWVISKREDSNIHLGMLFLCRKVRIR